MEELLKTLAVYAKQSRLVPAEHILTNALLNFEKLVPVEMSDNERENIEKVLLSLFTINKGHLSFQCSVRIATCLLAIYKTCSPPKVWNLFQNVTAKPLPSNVIATGFILYISNGVTRFSFVSSQNWVTVTYILLVIVLPVIAVLSVLKNKRGEEFAKENS